MLEMVRTRLAVLALLKMIGRVKRMEMRHEDWDEEDEDEDEY